MGAIPPLMPLVQSARVRCFPRRHTLAEDSPEAYAEMNEDPTPKRIQPIETTGEALLRHLTQNPS